MTSWRSLRPQNALKDHRDTVAALARPACWHARSQHSACQHCPKVFCVSLPEEPNLFADHNRQGYNPSLGAHGGHAQQRPWLSGTNTSRRPAILTAPRRFLRRGQIFGIPDRPLRDAARAECISWKIAIRFGRPRYFTAVSPIIDEIISTTQPDPLAEAVNRDGKAHIPLAFDGHVLVFHGLKAQHHSQHDSFCLAHRLLTKRADS